MSGRARRVGGSSTGLQVLLVLGLVRSAVRRYLSYLGAVRRPLVRQ